MDNQLYWLWLLSIKGMGSRTFNRLLDHFGTPAAVYEADAAALGQVSGLKSDKAQCLLDQKDLALAQKAQVYLDKHHIQLIVRDDVRFPQKLAQIYDPPVAFFAKGNLSLLERDLCIGIVGSRRASPGGIAQAGELSRALSEAGVTIVSGFAKGIDSAAHEAALSGIGNTIAVLGCGINVCYPPENKPLYKRLLERGGLILSEYFPDTQPKAFHFPMRNRIISGLSDGVVVVEAAQKSGALITAKHALEQGKNVYAIPKDISLVQGVGCNDLLKDGAKLVTGAKDILEDYVMTGVTQTTLPPLKSNAADGLQGDERLIFNYILNGYQTVEQLEMISGLSVEKLNATLSILELEDYIAIQYGHVSVVRL